METRLEHALANASDLGRAIEWHTTTAYGTRTFTIADPDGNELGFVDHVA